ncbi:YcaO-like family protein [Dongia deserti]|uniref:YcaO-like family protein n=1 Tax=Dongia deserti TaxID=2268030 RepID=UPI0013C49A02|nr:YcaO-like family protein [Dongia deserti]
MILSSAHGELASRWSHDAAFHAQSTDDEKTLSDLARVGFVQAMNAQPSEAAWRWSGAHAAADRALLALLARFDLHLEVGVAADETVWIAAAIQEHGSEPREAFSGTGLRSDEAIRACLGEFAEFQSWLYRTGDSAKRCDFQGLAERAINPWDLLGFASAQRDQWRALNVSWQGYDAIPAPDAFDGEIDWTGVEALTDQSMRWLPSQICFGHYGARADCTDHSWRGDSNGCATGPTRDSALAHALLELVERDATGIWWYAGVQRPAVPPSLLDNDLLAQALAARERMGQQLRLLDLTHDLEIPVIAAILSDTDGNLLALGFGCHADRVRAVRSAYREMRQVELSIAFAKRRVAQAGDAARAEDRRLLTWLTKVGRLSHLQPGETLVARRPPNVACDDEQTIELVRERLRRVGLEAYVLDLRRTEIGVPAVRAFVPGLCHFKPRLGLKRLIDVPRALRWHDGSFGPQDLSDLPLLI